MRDLTDIVTVRFEIAGTVQLDMERVEADPVWSSVCSNFDVSTKEGMKEALEYYQAMYLQQQDLLVEMPSTNGPASPTGIKVEVINASISPSRS